MVYQKTVKQNKPVFQWRLNGAILLLLLTLLQQVSLKMIIISNMDTKKSFKSNWRGTTPNLFFYKMEPLTTRMGPYQTQLHIAFFLLSNDDSFFWTAVRIKSEDEPFFLCMPAWFKGFSSSLSVESASLAWLPKTIFECNLNEIAEATSHICDAFHNLVPLVLFKKREKNSSMGIFHKLYQITQIAISWFGLFIIGPYKTNFLLI